MSPGRVWRCKTTVSQDALAEAEAAVALAPRSVQAQAELGDILRRLQRPEEARQAFQKALAAAQTVHPEFQSGWMPRSEENSSQRPLDISPALP